jgi:hypothetical protein
MPRHAAVVSLSLFTCIVAAACNTDAPVNPQQQPWFDIGNPINTGSANPYTLAVIGDIPYGAQKLEDFPKLIALMNADPKVDVAVHLGDIKAGSSSPCTDEYFTTIRGLFDTFQDPLVYTPGDNEWTDCHVASKNNGLYTPTERLAAVRALFFPVPGQTLGGRKKQLLTQADDPDNSAFVENTMFMESRVVFAALNITGSNNDLASWGSPLPADAASFPTQADEVASRAQANTAWLNKAFALANTEDAAGVVLFMQADMWDPTAKLDGFDALVTQIGTLAAAFGKPVLILEGDSHRFKVDNPFSASPENALAHALHPSTPVAENVTRMVVEGSDGRTEYVRLTIDPKPTTGSIFSWDRVPLQ